MESKRGNIAAVLMLLLLVGGLAIGAYVVQQQMRLRSRATDDTVALVFNKTDSVSASTSATQATLDIIPTVGSNPIKVSAVSVVLNYDPAKLTINSVSAGDLVDKNYDPAKMKMLNKIDTSTPGKIKIDIGAPCTTSEPWICYPQVAPGGAIVKFTLKGSEPATLTYDASSVVAGIDQNGNAINKNVSDGIARTLVVQPPASTTHKACQNWTCVTVAGPGIDTCSANSDCNGGSINLKVSKPENGMITGYKDQIYCGDPGPGGIDASKCYLIFPKTSTTFDLELHASGTNGYKLAYWTGDCSGTSYQCILKVGDKDLTVGAVFKPNIIETHRECRNNACVLVDGYGVDNCPNNCQPTNNWETAADFGSNKSSTNSAYLSVNRVGTSTFFRLLNPFTVEAWVKVPAGLKFGQNEYLRDYTLLALTKSPTMVDYGYTFRFSVETQESDGSSRPAFALLKTNPSPYSYNTNYISVTSDRSFASNTWTHLAVTSTSNGDLCNLTLFINGQVAGTRQMYSPSCQVFNSDTQALTFAKPTPGSGGISGYYFPGVVEEVRVSTFARYSQGFTPPPGPFSVDASTFALWHFNAPNQCNALTNECFTADSSGRGFPAKIVGNVQFVPSTIGTTATSSSQVKRQETQDTDDIYQYNQYVSQYD